MDDEYLGVNLGLAAGLALGLWLGANGDVESLSIGAAVLGGCAVFGGLQLIDVLARIAARLVGRWRS